MKSWILDSRRLKCLAVSCLFLSGCAVDSSTLIDQFSETTVWHMVGEVHALGESLIVEAEGNNILLNGEIKNKAPYLRTKEQYSDISMTMEFMIPEGSNSGVYFMGRYEIQILDSFGKEEWDSSDLGGLYERWDRNRQPRGFEGIAPRVNAAKSPGEWQTMQVTFRAPRFSANGEKISHAQFVQVFINGKLTLEDTVAKGPTRSAVFENEPEEAIGPLVIQGDHGPIAIRSLEIETIDLSDYPIELIEPKKAEESVEVISELNPELNSELNSAPLDADGQPMVDMVALGRQTFNKKGCNVCHARTADSGGNRTGPTLYGLLAEPALTRAVLDTAESHHIELIANENYIRSSVRDADRHLAKNMTNSDEPYPMLMPSYSLELLSDFELDAIIAYLRRLNLPEAQGAEHVWVPSNEGEYVLSKDPFAIWVDEAARLSRVDIGERHSGRAYHVGLPGGGNYSFDPRTMAIADIWSGPFLSLRNEKDGRASKASTYGIDANVWPSNMQHLFQPLDSNGLAVDFSVKEPPNLNPTEGAQMIAYQGNYLADVNAINARFLGVTTPKLGDPSFRYQINENKVEMTFIPEGQNINAQFHMSLNEPQSFLFPKDLLSNIDVSEGQVVEGKWTVEPGEYKNIIFKADYRDAFPTDFIDENIPNESLAPQPLNWTTSEHLADLLPGYILSDGSVPLDRFGREQLFEPMGIDFVDKDTGFVSTRTAGIWKISDGNWHLFAEGVFESLGVVAESENEVVIGEKPGLTRLIDKDNDNWAERRENLSDEFRFTSNYHEYLHGPVSYGDSYLYSLNLAHNSPGGYHGGGRGMTSSGGYRGWLIEFDEHGNFHPFASGLRSPAGLAVSPEQDIIYTENQGQFVGTSKIFKVEEDRFYGHPASLIDLPGMNAESPEIQWDVVQEKRERPLILLPHNQSMNSPGHPVWDVTGEQFGPFSGQMFLGDQTLSNIYRIDIESVNGIEQGAVLPFADKLASGVMRMTFNPNDSSLWLGQTARGWSARGGQLSALQRISWNGEIPDAIKTIKVMSSGFEVVFTKPQKTDGFEGVEVSSWHYLDSPNYGSPEIDLRNEDIVEKSWNADKSRLFIRLDNFQIQSKAIDETSRVYRFDLSATDFGETHSPFHSKAFYTLHSIPSS